MDYLTHRTRQTLGRFLRKQQQMPHRYQVRIVMERRDPYTRWPEVRLIPSGVPHTILELLRNEVVNDCRALSNEEWNGLHADPDSWSGSCSPDGTRTVMRPTQEAMDAMLNAKKD